MKHVYSIPSLGYLTLWPRKELGDDFRLAMTLAKMDPTRPRLAHGYALEVNGQATRISVDRIEHARVAAMGWMARVEKGEDLVPIWIHEAVAIGGGDRIVFRRLERIEAMRPSDAPEWARTVTGNGVTVDKAAASPVDVEAISARLAGTLKVQDAKWSRPLLRRFLEMLNIDWGNATPAQVDRAFSKGHRFLKRAGVKPLINPWVKAVDIELGRVGRGTRQYVKQTFLPRISPAFRQVDRAAVKQIATQQGWFLRNQMGRRADNLTARGREIVGSGLRQGLGRNEIGQNLKLAMPDLWNRYGNNYANVTAAVAVNRARSYSELSSYKDGKVEYLELMAVLDEATTVTCRFLDGEIISVDNCMDLLNQGANVTHPEDISKVNPFIEQKSDPGGGKFLQTTNGVRIADVVRSGVGVKDDRGAFMAHMRGNQLAVNALVGPPPYHHL